MDAELEKYLWERVSNGDIPRNVICDMLVKGMIQNEKQAYRTLEKWSDRGVYDYGITIQSGWIMGRCQHCFKIGRCKGYNLGENRCLEDE
jgi:hypothetical protein